MTHLLPVYVGFCHKEENVVGQGWGHSFPDGVLFGTGARAASNATASRAVSLVQQLKSRPLMDSLKRLKLESLASKFWESKKRQEDQTMLPQLHNGYTLCCQT